MSAVLLAVFEEYDAAVRMRVELMQDGFPTDRVELTAGCEPGRAGLEPAATPHERLLQYFRVLFRFEEERQRAELLAELVGSGAATITVHPRGVTETTRAVQILADARPLQLLSHDLATPTRKVAARRWCSWIFGFGTR